MDHPTCWYDCTNSIVPDDPTAGNWYTYWDFHFGCKEITLAPGESTYAFDGWHDVTSLLVNAAYHELLNNNPLDPQNAKTITLSQDAYNSDNQTTTDWHFNGQYTDFLEGCSFDKVTCNFENQPNIESGQSATDCDCCINGWEHLTKIIPKGGGRLTGTLSVPNGNQVTMMKMLPYPAIFRGQLLNAVAGTELRIWAPVDTANGHAVIDSGRIWTDTIANCASDTLKFSFPFLIPPMSEGLRFEIRLPNDSCSNIGNGRRIQLSGDVLATTTTTEYDSSDFMYWVAGTFVMDTTPPTIANFELHQLDSTRLEIRLQGMEDTTMINKGYVKYRVNGGSQQMMMLRYESNDTVNNTTKFIDTLESPIAHAEITIRGFIGNQLGLKDSTVIDTCQLLFPAGIREHQSSNLDITSLSVDHETKTLTLDLETGVGYVTIDLITIDGMSTPLINQTFESGEHRIVKSFSRLGSGAYLLVIRSAGELLVKRIIL
jgi:hypothetical protein